MIRVFAVCLGSLIPAALAISASCFWKIYLTVAHGERYNVLGLSMLGWIALVVAIMVSIVVLYMWSE